jgi:hypothetical protein
MQLPGLELMRLSLDIIELVKKREKTSTIFSTFFDLKNASQIRPEPKVGGYQKTKNKGVYYNAY